MATAQSTIEYIEDQLSGIPYIHSRKMFGEYALYCDDKIVALVCDNTLFVKITGPGREWVGKRYTEGIAYPSARPSICIDEDMIEDREWLEQLIRITEAALPVPKPKKRLG